MVCKLRIGYSRKNSCEKNISYWWSSPVLESWMRLYPQVGTPSGVRDERSRTEPAIGTIDFWAKKADAENMSDIWSTFYQYPISDIQIFESPRQFLCLWPYPRPCPFPYPFPCPNQCQYSMSIFMFMRDVHKYGCEHHHVLKKCFFFHTYRISDCNFGLVQYWNTLKSWYCIQVQY